MCSIIVILFGTQMYVENLPLQFPNLMVLGLYLETLKYILMLFGCKPNILSFSEKLQASKSVAKPSEDKRSDPAAAPVREAIRDLRAP